MFYFLLLFKIYLFIVIQLQLSAFSPLPSTPPQPVPPPSPTSTLTLDFVLVSFIVAPMMYVLLTLANNVNSAAGGGVLVDSTLFFHIRADFLFSCPSNC